MNKLWKVLEKLLPWIKQNDSSGEAWEVRWTSRFDDYSTSTLPEVKVFPNKEEAVEFAKSLRQAFKLIRHTSGNRVYINKVPCQVCYGSGQDIKTGSRCNYCNGFDPSANKVLVQDEEPEFVRHVKKYRVQIRRSLAEVKPEAEQLDGKEFYFMIGWRIEEGESTLFGNEFAMVPRDSSYPEDAPQWIASGDLQIVPAIEEKSQESERAKRASGGR